MAPHLIIIGGPTATGKSDIALGVAAALNAEIINADSMQLYLGMDIGTAKLLPAERRGIAHHLLDVITVENDATVAWYQTQARALINKLLTENKSVVVVGGTGLYIKSILDDLNFPDSDLAVREKLETLAKEIGAVAMHERLSKLDPAAALAIPYQNQRRVIRALEVIEITGKPFTANLPRQASSSYPNAKQYAFNMERDLLDEKIKLRTIKMFEQGLVAETQKLIEAGLLQGKTAKAAIGYAQVISHLNGEIDLSTAQELTEVATRQYARRQLTWFGRDERITWLNEGDENSRVERILSDLD